MKHYKGELGDFVFDPKMFEIQNGDLVYTGGTHYGCIKCKIPEGILRCDRMFKDNKYLKVGPVLPKSCISADEMFAGCSQLVVYPDINLALMQSSEFNAETVFSDCKKLIELSVTADGEKLNPWVCACEHSVDFNEHVTLIKSAVSKENERRAFYYGVRHPVKQKHNKLKGIADDINALSVDFSVHKVDFDTHKDLVTILQARKHGIVLGIKPVKNTSDSKVSDSDTDFIEDKEPIDSEMATEDFLKSPDKMRL